MPTKRVGSKKSASTSSPSLILYQKLIEHMNEAVWMGDKHERTIYANPKFCNMMGYTLEEMLGKESYTFWDEESAGRVREVNVQRRKKGESSSYEGTLLTGKGKRIPVLVSGTPLPDGGTIGIMTDLTEVKKHESMYRKLVEHMNEGVWMGDKQERTIYANPKFCSMMGYTLEEMLGKESYEFWDEESAARVRDVNHSKRKKGISSSYEGNLLTKVGEKIPVLLSGTPLPDGGTIGIMTDLTELKRKQEAERILSSAIQFASDAIVIVDQNGWVTSWNKGAKVIFGYKKEEIIGKSIHLIFPQLDSKKALQDPNVVHESELEGFHKNKRKVTVAATITPLLGNDKKKVTFYLFIGRDVTNQNKVDEELGRRYDKMQDAYDAYGLIRRQMDYFFELLETARNLKTPKEIADFIVSSSIMLTHADAAVLRQYKASNNTLVLISSFGVGSDWQGKATLKFEGSLAQKAFQQKNSLKIVDVTKEFRYQSPHLAKQNNLCSLLLIPLQYKNKPVGTLSLYTGPEKSPDMFEDDFVSRYTRVIELIMGTIL